MKEKQDTRSIIENQFTPYEREVIQEKLRNMPKEKLDRVFETICLMRFSM